MICKQIGVISTSKWLRVKIKKSQSYIRWKEHLKEWFAKILDINKINLHFHSQKDKSIKMMLPAIATKAAI